MGYILDEGRINEKREDILLGRRCGDSFLWRFSGGGSLSGVSEGNVEILGGDMKKERPLIYHGEIKGVVQR